MKRTRCSNFRLGLFWLLSLSLELASVYGLPVDSPPAPGLSEGGQLECASKPFSAVERPEASTVEHQMFEVTYQAPQEGWSGKSREVCRENLVLVGDGSAAEGAVELLGEAECTDLATLETATFSVRVPRPTDAPVPSRLAITLEDAGGSGEAPLVCDVPLAGREPVASYTLKMEKRDFGTVLIADDPLPGNLSLPANERAEILEIVTSGKEPAKLEVGETLGARIEDKRPLVVLPRCTPPDCGIQSVDLQVRDHQTRKPIVLRWKSGSKDGPWPLWKPVVLILGLILAAGGLAWAGRRVVLAAKQRVKSMGPQEKPEGARSSGPRQEKVEVATRPRQELLDELDKLYRLLRIVNARTAPLERLLEQAASRFPGGEPAPPPPTVSLADTRSERPANSGRSPASAIAEVVNQWWHEGAPGRQRLDELCNRSVYRLDIRSWDALQDTLRAFVGQTFCFRPSSGPLEWLWHPTDNGQALAAPLDPALFQVGEAMHVVRFLFQGFESVPRNFRFGRLDKPCRLRPVEGHEGHYQLVEQGFLTIAGEPAAVVSRVAPLRGGTVPADPTQPGVPLELGDLSREDLALQPANRGWSREGKQPGSTDLSELSAKVDRLSSRVDRMAETWPRDLESAWKRAWASPLDAMEQRLEGRFSENERLLREAISSLSSPGREKREDPPREQMEPSPPHERAEPSGHSATQSRDSAPPARPSFRFAVSEPVLVHGEQARDFRDRVMRWLPPFLSPIAFDDESATRPQRYLGALIGLHEKLLSFLKPKGWVVDLVHLNEVHATPESPGIELHVAEGARCTRCGLLSSSLVYQFGVAIREQGRARVGVVVGAGVVVTKHLPVYQCLIGELPDPLGSGRIRGVDVPAILRQSERADTYLLELPMQVSWDLPASQPQETQA